MAKTKKQNKQEQDAQTTEIVSAEADDTVATTTAPADIAEAEGPKTPKIVIDGVEYDASDLSDPAKGAVASLQFAEAKLMALQNELAVCQTARFAYIKGLKSELEDKAS